MVAPAPAPRLFLVCYPHCLHLLPASPSSPSPPFPSDHPTPARTTSSLFKLADPIPRRRIRCLQPPDGGRPAWGSNAESVRPGRFRFWDAGGGSGGGGAGAPEEAEEGEGWVRRRRGKRRWWSAEPYGDDWDDDEGSDLLDDELEQPWEKIWIFKVFKSYGYLLPAIIASMLLATGPKAFLMALALPLGQSVLSLAVDKLWGNASRVRRPKPRSKKKPFGRPASNFRREEEEEINRGYQERETYRSWMAADAVAGDREDKYPAFGGWDELDRRREYAEGPARQQQPNTTSTGPFRAQTIKKGKLSRSERNKELPLLLRLLIAVFPFLGSWTRIL